MKTSRARVVVQCEVKRIISDEYVEAELRSGGQSRSYAVPVTAFAVEPTPGSRFRLKVVHRAGLEGAKFTPLGRGAPKKEAPSLPTAPLGPRKVEGLIPPAKAIALDVFGIRRGDRVVVVAGPAAMTRSDAELAHAMWAGRGEFGAHNSLKDLFVLLEVSSRNLEVRFSDDPSLKEDRFRDCHLFLLGSGANNRWTEELWGKIVPNGLSIEREGGKGNNILTLPSGKRFPYVPELRFDQKREVTRGHVRDNGVFAKGMNPYCPGRHNAFVLAGSGTWGTFYSGVVASAEKTILTIHALYGCGPFAVAFEVSMAWLANPRADPVTVVYPPELEGLQLRHARTSRRIYEANCFARVDREERTTAGGWQHLVRLAKGAGR